LDCTVSAGAAFPLFVIGIQHLRLKQTNNIYVFRQRIAKAHRGEVAYARAFDTSADLECGFLLKTGNQIRPSAFQFWLRGLRTPIPLTPCEGHGSQILKSEAMNTEKFEDHHEGWRTLWLAIAGMMAIALTWNVLMVSLSGISY
jgi:hypothetical protein